MVELLRDPLKKKPRISRATYWVQRFIRASNRSLQTSIVTSMKLVGNPRIETWETYKIIAQITYLAKGGSKTFSTATLNLDQLIQYIEQESAK